MNLQNQDREPKFGTWTYQRPVTFPNQDQDVKPQSGTSSILKTSKSGLKGHGCHLNPQNQDIEQKFGTWKYQRPVTLFKSRLPCQALVKNFKHPANPKIRTKRRWTFFATSKSR